MVALIALRSLLLATVEAPETRYTLECFPLLFILAAVAFARCDQARATSNTLVVPGGGLMRKTSPLIGWL